MRAVLAMLLLAAAAASTALAGKISIGIQHRAELRDGALVVTATIRNSGDEAAQTVMPVLRFQDKEVRAQARPSLEPDASMEETLSVPVGELGEGRWPFRLAVDYTDLNQYPFQALEVHAITVGNPPPAKLSVKGPTIEGGLAGSGTLRVEVKNLSADARKIRVLLQLPEGLEAQPPAHALDLAGWGEKTLKVSATNRTALAGSKYPVFAIAEYEDGPVHHAVVGRGMVEIVAEASRVASWRPWLFWAAGALVAVWVAVLLLRARGS